MHHPPRHPSPTRPDDHDHLLAMQILQALDLSPRGLDLDHLHTLLLRSWRAESMLPVMGRMVVRGLIEKDASGTAAPSPIRRGEPQPLRFRLTDAGRQHLQRHGRDSVLLPRGPSTADPADAGGDAESDVHQEHAAAIAAAEQAERRLSQLSARATLPRPGVSVGTGAGPRSPSPVRPSTGAARPEHQAQR